MTEMLYFTSPTCMPCKQLKPKAKALCDSLGLTYTEIDIMEQAELAGKYGVMKVPAIAVKGLQFQPTDYTWLKVKQMVADEVAS